MGPFSRRGGDLRSCSIKRASIIKPLLRARRLRAKAARWIDRDGAAAIRSQSTTAWPPHKGIAEPVCLLDLFGVDSVPDGHFR
jgi:hypothetical protein